jgi:SAM-dependent methyltransferase
MRDATPSIVERVYRKLRTVVILPQFRRYVAGIDQGHPLHGLRAKIVGDASADGTEFFDHYDAYAAWAAQRIFARGTRLKTLDVGSVKMMNAVLAAAHDVTSLVLADCGDRVSSVRYIVHDVADKLPFADATFDVFTSMVALGLVGLGRYGDRVDPDCLVNLIAELDRVMKPNADLVVSVCFGRNALHFNNTWLFDIPTIERLFGNWRIVDRLVDRKSSPAALKLEFAERFSSDSSVADMPQGTYRVIFLHLKRKGATTAARTPST